MYIRCTGITQYSNDGENWNTTDGGYVYCNTGSWEQLTSEQLASDLIPHIDTVVLSDLYDLLNSVFSTPSTEDISLSFMAGISLPLICYLASFGVGSVVNFINQK